jgi:Na+/melibiose symporter-like transporter
MIERIEAKKREAKLSVKISEIIKLNAQLRLVHLSFALLSFFWLNISGKLIGFFTRSG